MIRLNKTSQTVSRVFEFINDLSLFVKEINFINDLNVNFKKKSFVVSTKNIHN